MTYTDEHLHELERERLLQEGMEDLVVEQEMWRAIMERVILAGRSRTFNMPAEWRMAEKRLGLRK